jgi:hypothetical protein
MWWIVVAVVTVAVLALVWWSSGRKSEMLRSKAGKSGTGVSDAHDAGRKVQRQFGGPGPG